MDQNVLKFLKTVFSHIFNVQTIDISQITFVAEFQKITHLGAFDTLNI